MVGNSPTYFSTPPANSFYPWHHGANVDTSYDVTSCITDRLMATPVGSATNNFVYPLSVGQLNSLQIPNHHRHHHQQQQPQEQYTYHLQQSQQALSEALLSQSRIAAIDDAERALLPGFFQTGNSKSHQVDQNEINELNSATSLLPTSLIKRSTSVSEFLQATSISGFSPASLSHSVSGFSVSVPSSSIHAVGQLTRGSGLVDRVLSQPSSAVGCFTVKEDKRHAGANRFSSSYDVANAATVADAASAGTVRQRGMFKSGGVTLFQTKALMSAKVRGSRSTNFVKPRPHSAGKYNAQFQFTIKYNKLLFTLNA